MSAPRLPLAASALAAALVVTFACSLASLARAEQEPPCPAAPAIALGELPRLKAALARGERPVIVAIGSSSTQGHGATAPDRTYPARLAAALGALWPSTPPRVVNEGKGGETDIQMVERIATAVAPHRPDLVVWQLGTNTLMRSDGVASAADTIRSGIRRLKALGADVVLMDPQYAPRVLADPDHLPMVELLATVAREEQAALFGRFALMQGWQLAGLAADTMLIPDGLHHNDLGYRCIASTLATALAGSSATASTGLAIKQQ
ncbi:MAG: SGNH/GDSL hydrolase family protein [Reyranellaceae bacterium]